MSTTTTTNLIPVPYRVGSFISSISVSPTIIKLLDRKLEKEGSDTLGKSWCSSKACLAHAEGRGSLSPYVRELALVEILPEEHMKNYTVETKYVPFSFTINSQQYRVKLFAALYHAFMMKVNGDVDAIRAKVSEIAEPLLQNRGEAGKRDLSFLIREQMIADIAF